MSISVVMNVVNRDKFLEKYSCIFTSSMNQDELADYARLRYNDLTLQVSDKFETFVQDHEGKTCPQLPILDAENTLKLAARLIAYSEEVTHKITPIISKIREKIDKNWTLYGANLLSHVILGYQWQYIWTKLTVKEGGGTVTFVDSPHSSYVLFPRTFSLDTDKIFIYWQRKLSYNDYVYNDIFNRPNMIKTIRSMDENGIMLPFGNSEETLSKMRLVKRSSHKGSNVTSYKSVIPEIKLEDVKAIEEELTSLCSVAMECFPKVIERIIEARDTAFKDMFLVDDEDMLQAGYYVWSYLIYEQLRSKEVI